MLYSELYYNKYLYRMFSLCSRQQLSPSQRTDSGLSDRVLQRVLLQDLGVQPGRGDAEVLPLRLHVRRADRQGDNQ